MSLLVISLVAGLTACAPANTPRPMEGTGYSETETSGHTINRKTGAQTQTQTQTQTIPAPQAGDLQHLQDQLKDVRHEIDKTNETLQHMPGGTNVRHQ
jgi:TolA-binding protein